MNGNITTAPLGGNRNIKTKPLFQYDYGQVLKIVGVTLPAAYEVHFSNQLHGVATTQIGNADGVIIPDIYLTTGEPVYAWIYLHTGNSDGETEYTITIPVVRRASISDAEPTPVQQDVITQAIAALNTAVEQTAQDVQDATEAKEDAEEAAGNAYESAVAAAQSAANAGTYAGQAQSAQAASELAQQKAEEAQTGAQTAKWAAESAQTAAEAAQAGAVAARTGAETAQAWAVAARSGAEAAQHAAEAARDEITGLSATANTLPAGSDATASYSNGLLTIGVPKGEKGDHGDTGATPDLTIGTVQTLPAGSSATATITGTAEDPVLNLGIPKGDAGEVTQAEFDALADDVSDMQDTLEHKADIDGYYTDMTVGAAEQVVSSTMVEDNAPYKIRTSGGSTDIGNRAYVDKIVGGTVAWNQQVRDAASENVTEYADVVTVTDAVEDDAAVSVQIEPVQDLHGYDSPWPAGGGKNLLDINGIVVGNTTNWGVTVNGDTLTVEHKTEYTTGIPSFAFNQASGTYVISIGSINTSGQVSLYVNGSWSQTINNGDTFTIDSANTNEIKFSAITGQPTIINKIQIEAGSTATSYAPYENICPISGWDEVNVTRTGKNLLPQATSESYSDVGLSISKNTDGTLLLSGTSSSSKSFVFAHFELGAGTYTFSGGDEFTASNGIFFYIRNLDAAATLATVTSASRSNSFTLSSTTNVRFYVVISNSGLEWSGVFKPQLEFGSTATAFEAYQGTQYTIEMPTEAGTVYGGELTVNKDGSGQLVVDRAEVDLGTLNWTYISDSTINFRSYENIGAKPAVSAVVVPNAICSALPVIDYTSISQGIAGVTVIFAQSAQAGRIWARNTSYTDAASFKAAMTGVKLVYELETTITYQLTATQVRTILGTNNVWSDAGQLSLTYTGTDEYLTLTSGRKYLTRINGTDSMVLGAGQEVIAVKGTDNVFDLTQMFGTAVADYVYQQGAGYFRKWFSNSRYAYNAGELISVQGLQSRDATGFNQIDITEFAMLYPSTCSMSGDELNCISHADLFTTGVPIQFPKSTEGYCSVELKAGTATNVRLRLFFSNGTYQEFGGTNSQTYVKYGGIFNRNADLIAVRLNWTSAGTFSVRNLCINYSHNGSRNGEYEPYAHRSYPLDSTLTLRGIPKVGSNGVYWDGDEYGYDGAVKRRYGVVDLGTLTWVKYNANNGNAFVANVQGAATRNNAFVTNIICAKYAEDTSQNNAYYIADGTCKFGGSYFGTSKITIVDSAYTDAAVFKAAMSGVMLVYELATPTTDETATPYQHIQSVDDWGTEEFVSNSIVPVGHQSRYPQNLRDKLQHLPALASSNGSYLITQTDGQMVLSPFPAPPTTAGNYLLKATVSGGNATYTWEVAT